MKHEIPVYSARQGGPVELKSDGTTPGSNVGSVFAHADGRFELSLAAYPSEGSRLVFRLDDDLNIPDQCRPLAAIIDGPLGENRFEIGTVQIEAKIASVTFFGIPTFKARIVF